jgi:hypothetical protein
MFAFLKHIDIDDIKRAALLVRIADDMLQHAAKDQSADFECHVGQTEVQIVGEGFDAWSRHGVGSRFERLFNHTLTVRREGKKI